MAYRVRCKVWVETDEGAVLSPARVALLRQILKYPSLADAARALRIPYKKAHRLVASIDERMGGGVVTSACGGAEGGTTRLSTEGTRLLSDYEALCDRVFETLSSATILGRPAAALVEGAQAPTAPRGSPAPAAALGPLFDRARLVSGHKCAGIVLGVRMAVAGMGDLGLRPLEHHPDLRVVVETARCAADAIQAVSDTSLGRSSLRVAEFGKMAATFSREGEDVGIRVVALESSREAADRLFPDLKVRRERQISAYQSLPDEALLKKGRVLLLEPVGPPGRHPHERALCPVCSEAFDPRFGAFERGELRCAACSGRSYFAPLPPVPAPY